jgi:hypothetical protein
MIEHTEQDEQLLLFPILMSVLSAIMVSLCNHRSVQHRSGGAVSWFVSCK